MDNGVEMTKTVKIKERRDKKSKILLKKSSAEEINMKKSVNDKISTIEMSKTVKELDDQE
jgi:translation initiation factor 2B subunit (eIF-2B alpha/beta/delta family)|tara:strand:+ start:696 stop:875 length:180 start_codon:yes stop_codon:yes gene_type:complete